MHLTLTRTTRERGSNGAGLLSSVGDRDDGHLALKTITVILIKAALEPNSLAPMANSNI